MTGEQDVGENRTIVQETMDIYDKLPEGQKCLKEMGFSMDDGSGGCQACLRLKQEGIIQLTLHWAYFLGEIPTAFVKALKKAL